jgi:hypothetical protein
VEIIDGTAKNCHILSVLPIQPARLLLAMPLIHISGE